MKGSRDLISGYYPVINFLGLLAVIENFVKTFQELNYKLN
jgi:hypothetical protein